MVAKATVGGFAACAIAVALIRSGKPLDHGWWLAAYLLLVGAVAQVGLAWGYLKVVQPESRPTGGSRRLLANLLAWNLGTVVVPVGVLASRPILVALGSVVLLATLTRFALQTRTPQAGSMAHWRIWVNAYRALLVFLAGSVLVGAGLAGALPWQY